MNLVTAADRQATAGWALRRWQAGVTRATENGGSFSNNRPSIPSAATLVPAFGENEVPVGGRSEAYTDCFSGDQRPPQRLSPIAQGESVGRTPILAEHYQWSFYRRG